MGSTTVRSNQLPNRHLRSELSILVADPDPDTRELYRQCFELGRWAVVEASDGRDALAKALAYEPSVLVTETRLPFIDGVALCELLRLDPTTNDVLILVVTGECRAAEVERLKRAGADAVLTKPTLPDSILETATQLIQRSTASGGHSPATGEPTAEQMRDREILVAGSGEQRRLTRCRVHARLDTVNPPTAPPALMCPWCDSSLKYDHSHVGGVSDRYPERWDYYVCSTCGTFQYRQRTRKLRR
jgi:CheY-like chemotaxis protein